MSQHDTVIITPSMSHNVLTGNNYNKPNSFTCPLKVPRSMCKAYWYRFTVFFLPNTNGCCIRVLQQILTCFIFKDKM